MFFRGYVETKNKKCLQKFKNNEPLLNIQQARKLPEFAGILNKDAILIDIDDEAQSELLLKIIEEKDVNCRVYRTTRGRHFLFQNTEIQQCSNSSHLACGLLADIKSGFKNSYSILKFGGVERSIERDVKPDAPCMIPKWLHPVRTNMDFLGMQAGDGRNTALFSYILTLQSNDFSTEEAREAIRIINDYVLDDPLSEDELETILRDDAFQKPLFFKGQTFLFDRFAIYLKNRCHITRINNQLHMYQDGVYISGYRDIEAEMLKYLPFLNRTKRREVLDYLELLCLENAAITDARKIAFRNGILDIETGSFGSFSPDYIITNKIDWDYNPNAYDQLTDETLNRIACHDPTIRALLEEATGYCFFRRNELGKAFILTGEGSNGKSTFLTMLKCLLGENNYSTLDLKKLDDRFSTVMLFGAMANIGDDISEEFIVDPSVFKKMVTGEDIDAEYKGRDKFSFKPYAKLFFSANALPRIGKGKSWASIKRRLMIIPFKARFSPSDPDFVPFIADKLQTQGAMEYMIMLGLEGLKRVLDSKNFSRSEKVEQEIEEYEVLNNPILQFMRECAEEEYTIENQPAAEVYKKYMEFCIADNLKPLSRIEFSRQIIKEMNLEIKFVKINRKTTRVFVALE